VTRDDDDNNNNNNNNNPKKLKKGMRYVLERHDSV
jgi:hypothetical protein